MPNPRAKGKKTEYYIRNLLRLLGSCERVPCSGNARAFKGDLVFTHQGQTYKVEVKACKKFPPADWLKNADFLVVKPDRKPPLVILLFDLFQKLFTK